MKFSIAILVIIVSVTCSPNPQKGPTNQPDYDLFDYFFGFLFDDEETYDFNNNNVTSKTHNYLKK